LSRRSNRHSSRRVIRLRHAVLFSAAVAAVLAALAAPVAWATEQRAPDADPIQARSYPVRFRPLADSAELVGAILSEQGEITLQPRLKTIVVRDHLSVLDQVGPLLESFDLPPRSVEVSVALALGTQSETGRTNPDELHPQDRGIWEVAPITGFTAFDPLGKRSIIGIEGSTVTTDLSEDYRVIFEVAWVDDDRVGFKSFALLRVTRTAEGEEQVKNVYSADITVKAGRPILVGAAQAPNSKKALFFRLEANPR
jgi:hypothetical protein